MSKKSVEKKLKGGFFSFNQKIPSGITLTSEETKEVIELWKEDVEVIKTNTEKLNSADTAIERNLTRLPESLSQVSNARNDAIRYFKITKDPIKRREWARRLIVADNAHKSIKASQDRMNVTRARIQSVVKDAALEKLALDVRISEAEAYVKMGEGLQLVGEMLVSARTRAKKADMEFSTLEFNTEQLEAHVVNYKDEKLIAEAEKILG